MLLITHVSYIQIWCQPAAVLFHFHSRCRWLASRRILAHAADTETCRTLSYNHCLCVHLESSSTHHDSANHVKLELEMRFPRDGLLFLPVAVSDRTFEAGIICSRRIIPLLRALWSAELFTCALIILQVALTRSGLRSKCCWYPSPPSFWCCCEREGRWRCYASVLSMP